MDIIIAKIYKLLKETENLIEFEECIQQLMYETFAALVGNVFSQMNQAVKEQKQAEGWKVSRNDEKSIICTFGEVRFRRTLMHDEKGRPRYPLDESLGFRKYQRHSPLVEVKVAEMASKSDYRETARILKEWTAVNLSHTTVGTILRRVGQAQALADEEMVMELAESDTLPEAKPVDFLYAEADGVYVRSTRKRKHIEVSHAMMYEGWEANGKRVALKDRKVLMTTKEMDSFWAEVQAFAANEYSLEHTQIVTNSDGGAGYAVERFKEAFSQTNLPILHQLDAYHVQQALGRTFGWKTTPLKSRVKKAIETKDMDAFKLGIDTYESTLEDEKQLERVNRFRTYILNHWDVIQDWRKQVKNVPEDARGLGAMESNQRHISFRMKRRGMHWSKEGAEAMVKVKQGILNGTLREVYLSAQDRSARKQRKFKQTVRISSLLSQKTRPSIGAKKGSIAVHAAHSSAIGELYKSIS